MPDVKIIQTHDPLYQLERELRREVLRRPKGLADESWEDRDEGSVHFVAVKEGLAKEGPVGVLAVLGCVLFYPYPDRPSEGRVIQMAVREEAQGTGVGRSLVEGLIRYAKGEAFKVLEVQARVEALGFYETLGFSKFGEEFGKPGFSHQMMKLEL